MWVRNKNKKFEEAADKNHSHTEYAQTNHSHSSYASKEHSHTTYKNKSDFAVASKSGLMLYGAGGGAVLNYPSGFNKDNCAIISVEFCPNGEGYGGSLIIYQNYKYLIYAELDSSNIRFGYRNISDVSSNDDKLTGTVRVVLVKV